MRVISKLALSEFWSKNTNAKGALEAWLSEAKHAKWKSPADIRATYNTASFLGDSRVVFNIKGGHYRLIVKIHYANDNFEGVVYIRFVDKHEVYDKLKNAETV